MQTAQEIFDQIVGKYHRELSPLNYENNVEAMKAYARQACEEQRKLCSHCLTVDVPPGPTHNLVLNAPEPELL